MNSINHGLKVLMLSAAFLASGCATGPATEAPTGPDSTAIQAALTSSDRPATDAVQDERRKSREILVFVGARPGMKVIDVFSAGGYYTELLSRIVGPSGKVIAYNNPPYAKFAEKAIATRYAGGRLANVEQVTADIEQLSLQPASLDAAIFVMSYHDLYWRPKDGGWPPTDPAQLLAKLKAALVPGGVVVVQDHVANAGGDVHEVVDKLHRIDPAVVKADFTKAGFVLDAESSVLAHPTDDHTKLVFDPSIQGQTDQFVYRFRKPK
jgi:predicted methyltransferase